MLPAISRWPQIQPVDCPLPAPKRIPSHSPNPTSSSIAVAGGSSDHGIAPAFASCPAHGIRASGTVPAVPLRRKTGPPEDAFRLDDKNPPKASRPATTPGVKGDRRLSSEWIRRNGFHDDVAERIPAAFGRFATAPLVSPRCGPRHPQGILPLESPSALRQTAPVGPRRISK